MKRVGPVVKAVAGTHRGTALLTVTLVLTIGLYSFENLAITTVMPAVTRDLGGLSLYGAAFSAYLLGSVVSLVIAGSACDRVGPFRVLTVGLATFTIGLLLAGLAPNIETLVATRAVQGAGGGAMFSAAYVGIALGYRYAQHARMFALLASAWVVPSFVAPALAALIAEHAGWRVVFLSVLPFPFVVMGLGARSLRQIPTPASSEPREGLLRPALSSAVGIAVLLGGADTSVDMSIVLRGLLLIVGGVLLTVGLHRLLPPGTLLARPGVPSAVLARGMLALAFLSAFALTPLALKELRGESLAFSGAVLAVPSVSWTAAAFLHSRWHERVSTRVAMGIGCTATTVGLALTWSVLGWGLPMPFLFAGWLVAGAGMGLAFNASAVFTMASATLGREGRAASGLQLAEPLGAAIGTGISGIVLSALADDSAPGEHAFAFVWLVLVLAAALSVGVAFQLGRQSR